MLASFDHRLRINRLIVPFESIVPSTIPFLDGETVNLGPHLALYPHLICPPVIQDYLIPASDPEDYQQSLVFFAGLGHGANRQPTAPTLVDPFSLAPAPVSTTPLSVAPVNQPSSCCSSIY